MDKGSLLNNFSAALGQIYTLFLSAIPQFLTAVLVVVVGLVLAAILRFLLSKILIRLDAMLRRFIKAPILREQTYIKLICQVAYWCMVLFSVAVASKMSGWTLMSHWLDSLVWYIPNFFIAFLIVVTGFAIAHTANTMVTRWGAQAGLTNVRLLALITESSLILTAVMIALEQLGVHIGFLTTLLATLLGVSLLGLALAFALGAQSLMANILGAQQTRRHCQVGDKVTIGQISGEITQISQTTIIVQTDNGQAMVPAQYFTDDVTWIQK